MMNMTDFKPSYKATLVQTVRYWWKNSKTEHWNRIDSPETDPHKYSQQIFNEINEDHQLEKF